MKKIKLLFIFVIFIGIIFGACNVIQGKNIFIAEKDVKSEQGIAITDRIGIIENEFEFYKTDQYDNPLEGARFKLNAYNDAFSTYSHDDGEGVYIFDQYLSNPNAFTKVLNSLSEKQRSFISPIKTTNDLKKFDYVHCNNFSSSPYGSGMFCVASLPTIYTIEEVKAPNGYAKTKVVIPGTIRLIYKVEGYNFNGPTVDSFSETQGSQKIYPFIGPFVPISNIDEVFGNESYNVKLTGLESYAITYTSMEYGEVDLEELVGLDTQEVYNIWEQYVSEECSSQELTLNAHLGRSSGNIVGGQSKDKPYYDDCGIIIKNYKGSANLSINTTVNEKESVSTTSNSKLTYRVNISNSGNIAAIDNKVVAKLPEGFNYVEGSASNNGKYNSSDNTITWTLYRIDEESNISLSYEAYAPDGLSSLKSYVGEASLESFSVSNRIESNKTTVRLMLNPKTNAPLYGIGITLIIVWGVALYLYFDHKRKVSLN